MKVDVHYYGMIVDKLGISQEQVNLDFIGQEPLDLKAFFFSKHPELKEMSFTIAVNQEIKESVHSDQTINEIAILPPFAGG